MGTKSLPVRPLETACLPRSLVIVLVLILSPLAVSAPPARGLTGLGLAAPAQAPTCGSGSAALRATAYDATFTVNSAADIESDPHVRGRDLIHHFGDVSVVGNPISFGGGSHECLLP